MAAIDPLLPLAGGLMIGTAAGGYLLFNGRIAGISGLASAALGLTPEANARPLSRGFIAGMLLGAAAYIAFLSRQDFAVTSAPLLLVVAGLLVGYGTRLGSGCTSGHGVCGLARLSPRSVIATLTFMAAAAVTVFAARHVLGGGA